MRTLLRDDDEHAERLAGQCPACEGQLRLVGKGENSVEFAKWYCCEGCDEPFMRRLGEIVPTKPRSGIEQSA